MHDRKLYIEFRVYFHPSTNQEMLKEVAEAAKDRIYDMFDIDVEDQPIPSAHDVTYQIVMEMEIAEDTICVCSHKKEHHTVGTRVCMVSPCECMIFTPRLWTETNREQANARFTRRKNG